MSDPTYVTNGYVISAAPPNGRNKLEFEIQCSSLSDAQTFAQMLATQLAIPLELHSRGTGTTTRYTAAAQTGSYTIVASIGQ